MYYMCLDHAGVEADRPVVPPVTRDEFRQGYSVETWETHRDRWNKSPCWFIIKCRVMLV